MRCRGHSGSWWSGASQRGLPTGGSPSCGTNLLGGGPAAAIGTGVTALEGSTPVVVVLACDMPRIATAIPVLLGALGSAPGADGVLARDGGRVQYLAGVHRLTALRAAVERRDSLHGASVRSLMDDLVLHVVDVPAGAAADIDTWDDVADAREDCRSID